MISLHEVFHSDIEDKNVNPVTTSLKFKKDLLDFFSKPEFSSQTALELGTHKGQTTRMLSFCFDKVYTINRTQDGTAQKINADRTNIDYVVYNLYEGTDPFPITSKINAFLIDAGHDYAQVISDISYCIDIASDGAFMVFDDYGLQKYEYDVRRAVDYCIDGGFLEFVAYIGEEPGYEFVGNRKLTNHEGVICKVINKQQ